MPKPVHVRARGAEAGVDFFTAVLADMPKAVLAAIVFLIGLSLIDVAGLQKIYRRRPSEFWIAARVGPENSRSSPRSMVRLATTATRTDGRTAMTENRLTIWMCSRAAARPRRRA